MHAFLFSQLTQISLGFYFYSNKGIEETKRIKEKKNKLFFEKLEIKKH